jgi:hypothetical protein
MFQQGQFKPSTQIAQDSQGNCLSKAPLAQAG